mgnify:FL=1
MRYLSNSAGSILTATFLLAELLIFPSRIHAQFNGDFTIERHFLDSENFLDWKAYQVPLDWEEEWHFTENGMRYSVGSISMYRFYVSKEIRLAHQIGSNFKVFYKQKEESFYTQEPGYQEAEFRFGVHPYFVSLTGFPEHSKKLGHMGFAISYGERSESVFVRYNQLEMFTVFNEKNANTDKNKDDRYYSKLPMMRELEMHYQQNQLFVSINHWSIGGAELKIKQPLKSYSYHGSYSELNTDWRNNGGRIYGLTVKNLSEYRRNPPDDSEFNSSDMEQTLGLRSYDVYLSWPWAGKNQLTLGVLSSLFENRIVSDSNAKRYLCRLGTDQLYGFWNHARSEWFRWRYSLQAGQAELSKDFLDIDVEPEQKTMEIKAGFGFILEKAKHYRFFVNTTWDLDLFKTRQWDGGSILLQFYF